MRDRPATGSVAPRARRRQGEPNIADMADAVAEAASREVTTVDGIKSGILIGPDPPEREAIEWRARCLVAAHGELRRRGAVTAR
jgi:hypothetical protein